VRRRGPALPLRPHALPVAVGVWIGDADGFAEGGQQVGVVHGLEAESVFGNLGFPNHKKRHSDAPVVQVGFVTQKRPWRTLVSGSVVGTKQDNGVFGQSLGIQLIDEPPNLRV